MNSFSETMRNHNLVGFENSDFIEVVGTRRAYELFVASAAAFLLDVLNDVE